MKEVSSHTSVDGESFSLDGPKILTETAGPFKRSLPYIESRKNRLLAESHGDFRDYDEVNAVTQS